MTPLQTAADPSPFHPGERAVQRAAGVREEAEKRGRRMLTAQLNAQQVDFFQALPFVITGHVDSAGQPWAGLFTGAPGFIEIEAGPGDCLIHWARAANPTALQPTAGDAVGLLGIELASRRRNRLNGKVVDNGSGTLRIGVQQGYGNCPKYITERGWPAANFEGSYTASETSGLSAVAAQLAARSDTFFIATASAAGSEDSETMSSAWGADVSHRGGPAGFLSVQGNTLRFDDFPGNNMFNTLGNITQHPHCGILLLDFASGEFVQLAARGVILPTATGREVVLDVSATRHFSKGDGNA